MSDRLIASSPWMRDWYIKHGLPADKFVLISPGVPSAPPSNVSREELLRELQLPADARLIGVIGRLEPENRVKDLIWAADLLRVLHDNLRLLIIGDGPLRPQLEEYARMASDLEHIQFLGERADAWRILPHLDVLWNASENVGLSGSILQAMAAGVAGGCQRYAIQSRISDRKRNRLPDSPWHSGRPRGSGSSHGSNL